MKMDNMEFGLRLGRKEAVLDARALESRIARPPVPPVVVPKVRHELKYIVPEALSSDIRSYIDFFCEADPNATGTPPSYTVSTLQLDTPNFALHLAKERKQVNRFKLRIRTYGCESKGSYFFEVKRKEGQYVRKSRSVVSAGEYNRKFVSDPSCMPSIASPIEQMNYLEFIRLRQETGARPNLHIRYERESWIGKDDRSVRITMDRNMRYRQAEGYRFFGDDECGWRSMDTSTTLRRPFPGMILEMKSALQIPDWILRMVKYFDLERTGFCKYSTAMRLESIFGGAAFNAASEHCAF